MTEVQKEILIAKMIDSPSALSDEEVDIILRDDELRDIYEMSAAVGGSLQPRADFDMDEEVRRFNARRRKKRFSPMRWIAAAAVLAGVVLAASLTGLFTGRQTPADEPVVIAKAEPRVIVEDTLPVAAAPVCREVSPEPCAPAKIRRPAHRQTATETDTVADELDVDEYLRIQQAAIDHEIAMQTARVIEEEYEVLNPEYDAARDRAIDNALKTITVQ